MIENISDFIISLLPNSDLFFLFYMGFIVLISVGVILFFSRKKEKVSLATEKKLKQITMESLLEIANNKNSTPKDLLSALMLFNENFAIKGNESKTFELFRKILTHKNRNKAIFDYFHNVIFEKNKDFKDRLDKIEREALNK